ncbi:hypothetical protein [Halococcus sp. PRR34]|uniref:hypothetical protein n=1 Tax=Halococcus sp. PRR34 TaxID=3020830 RepID=UPI0023626ED3|nr:hypothetical protein [Halococcus sp. PRR34]
MNPFLRAIREPVGAFADFAVLCAFLSMLIIVVWALTGNVVTLYEGYRQGGWAGNWDVNPPFEWVARLALVPAAVAIASWLVSAMFAMLG